MKISEWSVRRRVTTSMICLGIMLLGTISYHQLPLQLFPDVVYPGMGIYASLREATPREMEEDLGIPIENAIASLPGVRKIESWTAPWGTWTNVEFDFGSDMRFTFIELSERLEVLRKKFPKERFEYHLFQWDTNELQNRLFMEVCVTGEGSPEMLRDVVTTRIKQRLEEVNGIYKVELGGVEPHEMGVTLDPRRMRHYQVPFFQLVQRIQSWSNERVYLGKLETTSQQAYVRLSEKFGSADQLAGLTVDPMTRVKLADVADVAEMASRGESLYRVNGVPSVGLQLEKEARANPLRTAARVQKVLDKINAGELPPGYHVQILQSQAEILSRIIAKVAKLALSGVILAMIVLLVFVRHWLITLTVMLAIPLSIFGTFNLMYANDMTINILSMIGLTLAIGMLVDNSIVVLENIYRNYQLGKGRLEAACTGADEVGRAITASTLTTVIAFAPIFFLHGEVRLVFREMGLSIVYPLLFSLLVAVTFVPMATYFILSLGSRRREARLEARRRRGLFRRAYVVLLVGALRHRGRVLTAVGLVVFFTWAFQKKELDQGYLERNLEEDVFNVYVTMPEGSQRQATDKVVREIEGILAQKRKFPEIKRFSAWVYDDHARVVVRMDLDVEGRSKDQLKDAIRDETEGVPLAEIGFRRRRMDLQGGMVGFGETGRVELRGSDYDVLVRVAARVEAFLLSIPGIREVANDLSTGAPEVRLEIDREKASLLKINAMSIQQAVLAANAGGHVSQVHVQRGDDELAVVFRLEGADTRVLSDLRKVDVWSTDGRAFPLEDVARFTLGDSPGLIHRRDQERIAAITFTTDNVRKKIDVIADIKRLSDHVVLPPGYSFELEGEKRQIDEMLASLRQVLLLGFLLVYMVMAGLFEAFFAPLVIMFTVPLAIVGAIWGLLLSGSTYDAMAAMGSIYLLGVVVNNGIVFMDFVSMLQRQRNYSQLRALLVAGQYRMRPIFMTSLTTILGLLPLALKTGESNPWRPLAWVVIGGMTISTLLTLVVLPAVYLTLEHGLARARRQLARAWSWRRMLYPRRPERQAAIRERYAATLPVRRIRREQLREAPLTLSAHNLTVLYRNRGVELQLAWREWRQRRRGRAPERLQAAIPVPRRVSCGVYALHEVEFTLEPGMVGLLGPNGAGKTTLLRLLALLTRPTRGDVEICGFSARQHRSELAPLIGYLPQSFGFPGNFRCAEYLRQQAIWRGIEDPRAREEAVERALYAVNLQERKNDRIRHLSGGMRQRLGIAQTLLHVPRMIIVDEPTAGLDPMERIQFRNLLAGLAAERIVIFSTHIVEDIGASCDRLLVLEGGKLVYAGGRRELLARTRRRVWEWVVEEDAPLPAGVAEVAQTLVAEGRRVRVIAPERPAPAATAVEPRLQDAYFDLRRFGR